MPDREEARKVLERLREDLEDTGNPDLESQPEDLSIQEFVESFHTKAPR